MNPKLVELIKENTPSIDPRLGEGLAYTEAKKILEYVNGLFIMHSKSFPKGLKYLGGKYSPPSLNYLFKTGGKAKGNEITDGSRRYDITATDTRLAQFDFEFNGQLIRKYIYLPFIRRHGFIYLNGVKYIFTPVLADGVITAKPNCVFAKFLKIKLFFYRREGQFYQDGELKYVSVVYSNIHNKRNEGADKQPITNMSTLVNYLCCKYGMTQMLKHFGITKWKMLSKEEFQANKDNYPEDEWVLCESTGKKPRHTYKYMFYEPTPWVMLVDRKEYYRDKTIPSIIGSLFFTFDHYTSPRRINPDVLDDVDVWRGIVGESIHSSNEHYAVIHAGMVKHMASLDGYVDETVRIELARIGLTHVQTIYDFFEYIIINYDQMVTDSTNINKSSSMYGKQLQVMQYLMYNVTYAINNGVYFPLLTIKVEEDNNPNRVTTIDEIRKNLDKIKINSFANIKKWYSGLMVVDDPTDNPLFKLGRISTLQERSDKIRTRNSSTPIDAPENLLDVSLLEAGATYDMTKRNPAGRNRINLFVTLTDNLTIVPNPELTHITNDMARLMNRDD